MTWRTTTSHWGSYQVRSAGDEVEVQSHPRDLAPSELLGNVAAANRHPTRVSKPSVRRGWLENGPGPGPRGRDEFVEVSWERAIELVAGELTRVRAQHGNSAIFAGSYGWASAGRFHHAQSQIHRFLNAFGGYVASRNSYSNGTSTVLLPHIVGDADMVLRGGDSWDEIRENTELIVAFGGLPSKNMSVTPGGVTLHTSLANHATLADDVELVMITPLGDDVPPGGQWVSIQPATDVALMLGLAHTLLTESLHDKEFLATHAVGFERFADYLRGAVDGVTKDADWAAARTTLSADYIRSLARKMARSRTLVTVSWSLQRTERGEQPVWAGIALASMLGQIGLPGGGFGHGYGSMGDSGDIGPLLRLPSFPQGRNPVSVFIPVARISDLLLNPGQKYQYDGQELTYPDIKLVYWAGGNPFHHHQDLGRLREAFSRPDTIIVHEPHWTSTARHADIVLPVTTSLERNDFGGGRRDTHFTAMPKVVEAYGLARNDYDILVDLARAVGLEERFSEGRTADQWLEFLYTDWKTQRAAVGHEVPSYADFVAAGQLELPREPVVNAFADFHADPVAHPLATPSGKIELYSARIASFGYPDCPGQPTWFEPKLDPGYPFYLIANQPRTRLHSQGDVGAASQASKIKGREPIQLNRADAQSHGILAGDIVKVTSQQGSCLAGAVLVDDLRPGVVVLPTGAWFDPVDTPDGILCVHGNPNAVTPDVPASQLSQGCSGQHAHVTIARFDEALPPLTVASPPHTTT